MDVSFANAALTTLCNSEARLTQRWGPVLGRTLARQLLDLAAVNAEDIEHLPNAVVSTDQVGETTISFGDSIAIRGWISRSNPDRSVTGESDSMIVTRVTLNRKDRT
jgi:hypothetical protein